LNVINKHGINDGKFYSLGEDVHCLFYKQNEINDSQKSQLKKTILLEDPRLLELLAKYEKDSDRQAFRDNVISLIQDQATLPAFGVSVSKTTEESPAYDESASPLDNKLFQKKKHQGSGNEHNGLAQALKPMQ